MQPIKCVSCDTFVYHKEQELEEGFPSLIKNIEILAIKFGPWTNLAFWDYKQIFPSPKISWPQYVSSFACSDPVFIQNDTLDHWATNVENIYHSKSLVYPKNKKFPPIAAIFVSV